MSAACTLPKLTPRSTPLNGQRSPSLTGSPRKQQVISAHQMMIPRAYEVYPQRLPSAPDIPKRPINVLQPPPPKPRRGPYLETIQSHWFNQQRVDRMKQREHYRYHNAYTKYYYGSEADQEDHRAYTRTVLKQQMSDRDQKFRDEHKSKIEESVIVTERDNSDKRDDAEKFQAKFQLLKSYRDINKQEMEMLWGNRKDQKVREDVCDREQMRYNPINWSCTLT